MARGPLLLTVCPISVHFIAGKGGRSLPHIFPVLILKWWCGWTHPFGLGVVKGRGQEIPGGPALEERE